MKRMFKNYQRVVKELDGKGDYKPDYHKEFLLKYREDWPGLFRYYAEGSGKIQEFDLPFLDKIAELPDLNLAYVRAIAIKLDVLPDVKKTEPVLHRLIEKLTQEQKLEIFSHLQHMSLSTQEIRSLGREEQLRMIRNTPMTTENFCYNMDELLLGSDLATRGKYILCAIEKARSLNNATLKQAIVEENA